MEPLYSKVKTIFFKSQESSSRHHKCLQSLCEIYKEVKFELFTEAFLKCLTLILSQDAAVSSKNIDRVLDFAAKFCVQIAFPANNTNEQPCDDDEDIATHPLLMAVIYEIQKYHKLDYVHIRARACQFIATLLKHIGDKEVDNEFCDQIQDILLERIQDPKTSTRLQAITALERLQTPKDDRCPVVKAYLECLMDGQALVRKAAVENICVSNLTILKIIERVRDVDWHVRYAALTKCANLNPCIITVEYRQNVLLMGIGETNKEVVNFFRTSLLPKWLSYYDLNIVKFFSALKLDADEDDIQQTLRIYKSLMEILCPSDDLFDKIDYLALDDSKLVPLDQLNFETAAYWNILCHQLQLQEEKSQDEYLPLVQPELAAFSNYIKRVLAALSKKQMDKWEDFDRRQIMLQLLEIVERYDLSDEVGRLTLKQVMLDMLKMRLADSDLTEKAVVILEKLANNRETLIEELKDVISEILQPLVYLGPTEAEKRERDVQVAAVNVDLNELREQLYDPEILKDSVKCEEINKQIETLLKKLETINIEPLGRQVRQRQNDSNTFATCLDIIISYMLLPCVNSICPALEELKTELVDPLEKNTDANVHWRVLKVICLFGIMDKQYFVDNKRKILGLLILFRESQQYDKKSLLVAIEGACDMLRLYGCEAFDEIVQDSDTSQAVNKKCRRRRLYEKMDETTRNTENVTFDFDFLSNILLEILNSNLADVRFTAVTALMKLLLDGGAPPCPTLISKLILRWLSDKGEDAKVQQILGATIAEFSKDPNNTETIIQIVIPTIIEIATSPVGGLISSLDVDGALKFLAALLIINTEITTVNAQVAVAENICYKISLDPNARYVRLLVKMLLNLDFSIIPASNDLLHIYEQAEQAIEDMGDKVSRNAMNRFMKKLKSIIDCSEIQTDKENREESTRNNSLSCRTTLNEESHDNSANMSRRSQSSKRKKQRKSSVLSENLSDVIEETISPATPGHTNLEASLLCDAEIHISMPSQETSPCNKNAVVTETSSDSESCRTDDGKRSSKRRSGSRVRN